MRLEYDIAINRNFFLSFMEQNKVSENDLAQLIGISHSMLNRVLNGKRNPGSKFIAGVLKNCKVNFEDAFYFEESLPKGNKAS